MWAISWTARSNAASLAFDGFVDPLTLRTYCSAAAWISSSVAVGSSCGRLDVPAHARHGSGRQHAQISDNRLRGRARADAPSAPSRACRSVPRMHPSRSGGLSREHAAAVAFRHPGRLDLRRDPRIVRVAGTASRDVRTGTAVSRVKIRCGRRPACGRSPTRPRRASPGLLADRVDRRRLRRQLSGVGGTRVYPSTIARSIASRSRSATSRSIASTMKLARLSYVPAATSTSIRETGSL